MQFQKGNPGRPKGSRNRMKEDFLRTLADDFAEFGKEAIVHVRLEEPGTYLKIIASLMPKQLSDEDDQVVTPPVLVIKAWEPGDEGGEG